MPISKRRKKKGKTVKHSADKRSRVLNERLERVGEQESAVSLQDLINVLAYQEYVNDGTIIAPDVKVTMAEEVPVTVEDENGVKQRIGTAYPIEGDPLHVSIQLDNPGLILDPSTTYSIGEEQVKGLEPVIRVYPDETTKMNEEQA